MQHPSKTVNYMDLTQRSYSAMRTLLEGLSEKWRFLLLFLYFWLVSKDACVIHNVDFSELTPADFPEGPPKSSIKFRNLKRDKL